MRIMKWIMVLALLCIASPSFAGTETWPEGTVTVTFQQGASGFTGWDDTYLTEATPTTANGGNANAVKLWVSASVGSRLHPLLKCNISSIPATAGILDATLTLTHSAATTTSDARFPLFLYRLMKDWGDSTATWDTTGKAIDWSVSGGDSAASDWFNGAGLDTMLSSALYDRGAKPKSAICYMGNAASGNTVTFNVTEAVRRIHAGLWTNYGWELQTEYTANPDFWLSAIYKFHSSEAATAGNRPLLTVHYLPRAAVTDTVTVSTGTGRVRVGPGRVGPQ
jgi:hypothetical protein